MIYNTLARSAATLQFIVIEQFTEMSVWPFFLYFCYLKLTFNTTVRSMEHRIVRITNLTLWIFIFRIDVFGIWATFPSKSLKLEINFQMNLTHRVNIRIKFQDSRYRWMYSCSSSSSSNNNKIFQKNKIQLRITTANTENIHTILWRSTNRMK